LRTNEKRRQVENIMKERTIKEVQEIDSEKRQDYMKKHMPKFPGL